MTVSTPVHVNTNAPALSLAPLVGLRSPNSAKTIPFKNVLDAFQTPDDENVSDSGEQKANSQGTTSRKALPDSTPEPFRAPQHSTQQYNVSQYSAPQQSVPQIPLPTQRPAKLTAELTLPNEQTAESQPEAAGPENAIARTSAETAEPDDAGLRLTGGTQRTDVKGSTSPISLRVTAPPAARLTASGPIEETSASSAVEKSQTPVPQVQATALPQVQAQAPLVQAHAPVNNAVSIKTPVRAVAPVITSSEEKTQSVKPQAAVVTSQPRTTSLVTRQVPSVAPEVQTRLASPPAIGKSQISSELVPQSTQAPVSKPVFVETSKAAPAPATPRALDQIAKPSPAPSLVTNSTPTPVEPATAALRKPPSAPAEEQQHPVAVQNDKTATARQDAPATTPPASATTPSSVKAPVTAPVAQASIAPRPKPTDSRRAVSTDAAPSNSARTEDQPDTSKVPQTFTNVAQTPLPETTVVTSDIPEPLVASRGKSGDTMIAPLPAARIATTPENFAFAARMLPPDITPVHAPPVQTKAAPSPAELPVSEPKAAAPQAKPPAAPSQQPQNEPSSNSKRETPSSTPAEKPDTRAPKAAEVAQPEQTQGTVARWSEVSAPQASEAVYGRPAPELTEASHPNPALAAQETHVVTQELPKTSTSSEILLHLTGNDQTSAAIRVADRAGSVSVSIHASDPVLRESLRSNLGELSNQLGQQGWKAEMLKPAALAAQAEGQQDSHAGGQQSSQQQQQHSSGGERQPQRDRRTPSGIWQQELEQQISSGDAHAGGKG